MAVTRPEHVARNSPLPGGEFKNERSYTSPTLHGFIACTGKSLPHILTFCSLPVTLRTTKSKTQESCIPITLHLCVLYGSQNEMRLLPYTVLTDWFL